ncbi:DgyrCDS8974 [Dimorphilus gyrociliatus]|uniref:DgyrCDS8974 n=1 Tax=Dimorphilus gyrociliatus TaxID=2664684 RepID=A0A7I8VXF5_9ANNE|nr:DgyrCDS8974 [Dimorphilus gyrociliatus]
MEWLTGKSKSDQRNKNTTPLQAQRNRQIEQLKKVNPNVYEVQRGVDYRLNLVVSGIDILLFIHLPPYFPQDKPSITVSPSIQHPWVNEDNVISGCPELNDFVIHSDLGKIIKDILDNLKRNGRVPLPTQSNYPKNSTPMTSEVNNYSYANAMSTTTSSDIMPYPQYSMIPITSQTVVSSSTRPAQIYSSNGLFNSPNYVNESQSNDENKYKDLVIDQEKLIEMAMSTNTGQNIIQQKQKLFESNKQLAETNLNLKSDLEKSREKLLDEVSLIF